MIYCACTCTLVFTSVLVHVYRRALEAKAAIYARLSGGSGGGVREEEDEGEGEGEEPRYMVDFTRKIWEEVNCSARGAQ